MAELDESIDSAENERANGREDALRRREINFYRREKELEERELELVRREIAMLHEMRREDPLDRGNGAGMANHDDSAGVDGMLHM